MNGMMYLMGHHKEIHPTKVNQNKAVYYNNSLKLQLRRGQACLLFTTQFNIFLKRIIEDALESHKGTIIIANKIFINLCLADDWQLGRKKKKEKLAISVKSIDKILG